MATQTTTVRVSAVARGGGPLGREQGVLFALQRRNTHEAIVAYGFAMQPLSKGFIYPNMRGRPATQETAAPEYGAVELSVDLAAPEVFTLWAFGIGFGGRMTQTELTLLPGVDVGRGPQTPQGIVLEVPGLRLHSISRHSDAKAMRCLCQVSTMCGGEIRDPAQLPPGQLPPGQLPDSPWPGTGFIMKLVTRTRSGETRAYPMAFDGSNGPGVFSGYWPNQAPEDPIEQAWVTASQPAQDNHGAEQVFPEQGGLYQPARLVREILEYARGRGEINLKPGRDQALVDDGWQPRLPSRRMVMGGITFDYDPVAQSFFTVLKLPSWSTYWCEYSHPTNRNGRVTLFMRARDEALMAPEPGHVDAVTWLYLNERAVHDSIRGALGQFAPMLASRLKQGGDKNWSKLLTKRDGWTRLIDLRYIHVFPHTRDGLPYFVFEFECAWDMERDFNLLMNGLHVVHAEAESYSVQDVEQDGGRL